MMTLTRLHPKLSLLISFGEDTDRGWEMKSSFDDLYVYFNIFE